MLVGQDLVRRARGQPARLASTSPPPTQPALDAAAAALGGQVGAARTVPLDLVANDLGPAFTVVPLVGAGGSAALLVDDASLTAAAADRRRGRAATPCASAAPAARPR